MKTSEVKLNFEFEFNSVLCCRKFMQTAVVKKRRYVMFEGAMACYVAASVDDSQLLKSL